MPVGRCFAVYTSTSCPQLQHSVVLESSLNTQQVLCFENDAVFSLDAADFSHLRPACKRLCEAFALFGVFSLPDGNERFAHYLVLVTNSSLVGQLPYCDVHRITGVFFWPLRNAPTASSAAGHTLDARLTQIQKLLTCGLFLFGWSPTDHRYVDLSRCAQRMFSADWPSGHRFQWNHALGAYLDRYAVNSCQWLTPCICGVMEIKTIYIGNRVAKACLISRISSHRMGTRFNVRGVNDFGHVANFVETEQVIYFDEHVVSFVQTRGSVPLFWDQPGIQVGSHKIKINRSLAATAAAYERHIRWMQSMYQRVAIINLLSCKGDELALSQAYQCMHQSAAAHRDSVPFYCFDLHAEAKGNNRLTCLNNLWNQVEPFVQAAGIFHSNGASQQPISMQTGVLRINCLDCLDRTNSCQSFFARQVLKWQLIAFGVADKENICMRFLEIYKASWAHNGDQCSKLYTGTAAQEGKSKIKDASITVSRTIQGNLMDKSKQQTINYLLRNCQVDSEQSSKVDCRLCCRDLLAYPSLCSAMIDSCSTFLEDRQLTVFCGTWNVNGGQQAATLTFRQQTSLNSWLLLDDYDDGYSACNGVPPGCDVYAIGLQEMVDLSASNVLSASLTNQNLWREALLKSLNSGMGQYVLVESVQLVGVCLFLFVRPELVPFIRDVSTSAVKTGFGGTMGNKGGTAVSLVIFNSSFCFLCSHFAAGQSQILERNEDYEDTWRKMRFPSGAFVFSHDIVFWFGDFNYRIDMSGDEVKRAVEGGLLDGLYAVDQLNQQRTAGMIFCGFQEGPLQFAPTYKYDTFSDDYDTSEKARVPAWTDRVLFWERRSDDQQSEPRCHLRRYGRAELKMSDHRPVNALFDVRIMVMNRQKFRDGLLDCLSSMGPLDAAIFVRLSSCPNVTDWLPMIRQKISELSLDVRCAKHFGDRLLCVFSKPEDALAALSMDGVQVGDCRLQVELKSPDWQNEVAAMAERLQRDMLNDDAIDQQVTGASRLRLESAPDLFDLPAEAPMPQLPPRRPPPPSFLVCNEFREE